MTMYPDDWDRKIDTTKDSRWSSIKKLRIKANIARGNVSKNIHVDENLIVVEECERIISKLIKDINREKNE